MSDSEPYLICHLVRGEPAFDIAIKQCEGEAPCQPNCGCYPECKTETVWIIPTSGHRAYPFWVEPLMASMRPREDAPTTIDIYWVCDKPSLGYGTTSISNFDSWPDHYTTSSAPKPPGLLSSLASALGLTPPKVIRRR
jgi:hypothetical protein